ncbi:MAG TPA: STAS domain-containing protein [Polyangiaceae bacterium]
MSAFPVTRIQGASVLELPERVSVSNTRELLDAGLGALASGTGQVVLDLRGTQTIDSTALGAIVQLSRNATSKGRALVLLAPRDGVRRVLAITRLDQVLPIRSELGVPGPVS